MLILIRSSWQTTFTLENMFLVWTSGLVLRGPAPACATRLITKNIQDRQIIPEFHAIRIPNMSAHAVRFEFRSFACANACVLVRMRKTSHRLALVAEILPQCNGIDGLARLPFLLSFVTDLFPNIW